MKKIAVRLGSFLRATYQEMDMGLIWAILFAALIMYGSKVISYEGEKKAPIETKIVE